MSKKIIMEEEKKEKRLELTNERISEEFKKIGILINSESVVEWDENEKKWFYGANLDLEVMSAYVMSTKDYIFRESFFKLKDFLELERVYYEHMELTYLMDYEESKNEVMIYEQILERGNKKNNDKWVAKMINYMKQNGFEEKSEQINLKYVFNKMETLRDLDSWFSECYHQSFKDASEAYDFLEKKITKIIKDNHNFFKKQETKSLKGVIADE